MNKSSARSHTCGTLFFSCLGLRVHNRHARLTGFIPVFFALWGKKQNEGQNKRFSRYNISKSQKKSLKSKNRAFQPLSVEIATFQSQMCKMCKIYVKFLYTYIEKFTEKIHILHMRKKVVDFYLICDIFYIYGYGGS